MKHIIDAILNIFKKLFAFGKRKESYAAPPEKELQEPPPEPTQISSIKPGGHDEIAKV